MSIVTRVETRQDADGVTIVAECCGRAYALVADNLTLAAAALDAVNAGDAEGLVALANVPLEHVLDVWRSMR